jgi:AraC-like DNA-binding protein
MVQAGAGDTIMVNPGEVHDGAPIGDGGRAWTILYFDPALVHDAAGDLDEGRSGDREFLRPVVTDAVAADLFRRLLAAMTRGSDPLQHDELLLALLARVMREGGSDRGPAVPDKIARAKTLIDDDPTMPVTLADLARESDLSRFQVLRGFFRATGLTPHAYLIQRRIDLARRLIGEGTPLAQAAAGSGFADQSHMTRTFVRTYGLSPRAYVEAVT